MKFKILVTTIFSALMASSLFAQFVVSGEYRVRGEINNGVQGLPDENSEAAYYVSQRTRLNFSWKNDHFTTYMSLQDVRFWGEESMLSKTGINASSKGFDIYQAWFDWKFAKDWGLKLGRQMWEYDDSRILASRNWNQYALSWDALLLHLDKEKFHFHLGSSINNTYASFNRTNFESAGNIYEESLGYRIKYFNFLWFNFQASKNFKISVANYFASYLRKETKSTLYTMGTSGVHLSYKDEKIKALANAYYQYGKTAGGKQISAYLFSLTGAYQFNKLNVGIGAEYMSGNKADDKFGAFNLMYGCGFVYNGWMNHFLLTADTKNSGLIDIYPNITWDLGKKHEIHASYHIFRTAEDIYEIPDGGDFSYLDRNLGGELDFRHTYKFDKSFNIQTYVGYYFATPTAEFMDGIEKDKSTSPYWVSVMLTFKPTLFEK